MTYIFNLTACICVLVIQTTILPCFSIFDGYCNPVSIIIVYLGLFYPVRKGLLIVLIIGFLMDNLSGSPVGLFITIYFWLYLGTGWIVKFFHAGNYFILPFIAAGGVIIENLIFFGTLFVFEMNPSFIIDYRHLFEQVLWAFFTGPLLILLYAFLNKKWDKWISGFLSGVYSSGR